MERRKYLGLLAGSSPFLLFPNGIRSRKTEDTDPWLTHFKNRWGNSRTYCFEVFQAMPESGFDFRSTPETMSFGELFAHIGRGLDIYSEVLGAEIGEQTPEPKTREEVSTLLNAGFDHFAEVLDAQQAGTVYTRNHAFPDTEPWNDFSIFDIIMLGYNHTVHHIGQGTVYLRLKGITPPRYRF